MLTLNKKDIVAIANSRAISRLKVYRYLFIMMIVGMLGVYIRDHLNIIAGSIMMASFPAFVIWGVFILDRAQKVERKKLMDEWTKSVEAGEGIRYDDAEVTKAHV